MNIIKFSGGLGNQLFQYALYFKLLNDSHQCKIDINHYRVEEHDGFSILHAFDINPIIASSGEIDKFRTYTIFSRIIQRLNYDLLVLFDFQIIGLNKIVREHFDPRKNLKLFKLHNHYFYGFWQKELYLHDIRESLLNHLEFKVSEQNLSEVNRKSLNLIRNSSTLTIHIRGGDFKTQLTPSYFLRAIKIIESNTNIENIVVITNDKGHSKSKLKGLKFKLVDWNVGYDSFIDLYMMSQASNLIISNSTFSWWGAYLNKKANFVIAPKEWLMMHHRFLKLVTFKKFHKPVYLKEWEIV